MIFIDRRTGSKELFPLFPPGSASLENLEYGDFAWVGNGPGGEPWNIGVERKTLGDLLTSMATNRLQAHQLPGLLNCYREVYLVIEGIFRSNRFTKMIEVRRKNKWVYLEHGRRRYMYSEVTRFRASLEVCCGVRVYRTATRYETAELVQNLHRWWTGKEFEEHRSFQGIHNPPEGRVKLTPPNLVQKWAASLQGIGWTRSLEVKKRFKTPLELAMAGEKEWESIPGIGKGIARAVVKAIQEGK